MDVLALYGGADQSIPQETIEKCQAACKAAGISYCNIAREVCSDLAAMPCRCGHPKTRNLERYNVQPRRPFSLNQAS